MATITVTWRTMHDDKVCPICRDLEGFTWIFDVTKSGSALESGQLLHPTHGLVWSATLGSYAHGHKGRCRCKIDPHVDVTDLLERIKEIHQQVLESLPIPEGV